MTHPDTLADSLIGPLGPTRTEQLLEQIRDLLAGFLEHSEAPVQFVDGKQDGNQCPQKQVTAAEIGRQFAEALDDFFTNASNKGSELGFGIAHGPLHSSDGADIAEGKARQVAGEAPAAPVSETDWLASEDAVATIGRRNIDAFFEASDGMGDKRRRSFCNLLIGGVARHVSEADWAAALNTASRFAQDES